MASSLKIEVYQSRTLKKLTDIQVDSKATVYDAKKSIHAQKSYLYPERQMLKSDETGKGLSDEALLSGLKPKESDIFKLYLKDLGPQVGWSTVFLTEYAGPLVIYVIFYLRPSFIYDLSKGNKYHVAVNYACAAWVFHYAKRLLETIFVHRFSKATMPIMNIFKNSIYYWGFAAFVAYYINHPRYTPAYFGNTQIYLGLAGFVLSELGNLSIHLALRDLRPAGSKVRKIPYPTSNPFTFLFRYVSCPNYTYEFYSWLSFSVMTQSLPALIFTAVGFYQMTVWAIGKHRNYRKEFDKYPRGRKAIIPFVI